MITNEMLEVHLQPIQEKFIRISLLQNFFIDEDGHQVRKFKKVGEIQGNTIGGSINIDANSTIRRTCSIDMVITDSSFLISESSKIWIDKWFRVELGVKNLKTDKIVWFNKGIYAINNPSIRFNAIEKRLHIEGLDLMTVLDVHLGIMTKLPKEAGINDSMKTTIWQLGKISQSQIYIEQNDLEMPYDIEKSSTDTVYSIVEELKNLYMDWEAFFNVDGKFIYQKIKNRHVSNPIPNYENDIVTFRFLEEHDLVTDYNLNYLFDNVKNHIIIYGKMRDDGIQVKAELINTDDNSPFSINKNLGTMPMSVVDEKIFNEEQALERANYEFYKRNNMSETVEISCIPLYFLDVNRLIEFDKPEINLSGKFLIDTISIPLDATGRMSVSAHRVHKID